MQDEELYHYHLDHLWTPKEINNAFGKVVWAVGYRAYGNLVIAYTEEIENNLRFQGQCFDVESGLHYNRFRYYDPENGFFTSQDPIGLMGGDNEYRYSVNPIQWTDSLGIADGTEIVYRTTSEKNF